MIIVGKDLETTGFLKPEHRIIEVALVSFEYDPATMKHREIDAYVQRINPERSVPADATKVHGIYDSDLVGKPTFKTVAPEIVERLDQADHGVAHNGFDFDYPFTIMELERVGHRIPDFIPHDTMVNGRWATPFGKAPNLGELCFACGVDYDPAEAHAALYDVRVMMDCFFYGLRRGVFSLSTT